MAGRIPRVLLTFAACAVVFLTATACETVTEPLPMPPFYDSLVATDDESMETSPTDTTGAPGASVPTP